MSEPKVLACPNCGQKNRIRAVAPGVPVCAKCGKPLPWMVDVDQSEFEAAVEKSPVPVLVDFWAPWCGPCKIVEPGLERISRDLAGKVKIARVNTDVEPGLGSRFNVLGIPTLILFVNGAVRDRKTGALPATALSAWVESQLRPAAASRGTRSGPEAG